MKVYIKHGNAQIINEKDVVVIGFQDIPKLEASSCTELNISGVLDYVPIAERDKLFETCLSKLRYGGILHITGLDIVSMALFLHNGTISRTHACEAIYNNKLSAVSVQDMLDTIYKYDLELL